MIFQILSLLVFVLFTVSAKAQLKEIAGVWQFNLGEGDFIKRVTLAIKEDSICGTFLEYPFCTKLYKDHITFQIGDDRFEGLLKDNSLMEGTFADKTSASFKWKATKEIIESSGRLRNYIPENYYRNYSSKETPCLKIISGDTVKTTTIDARGDDMHLKHVAWGGNPLTGPFYLENAIPGDIIAIKIIKVKTNRDQAFSGTQIVDNVLEPAYLMNRKNKRLDIPWRISTDSGFIEMKDPGPGLKNYKIPLMPFLGCVGVASANGSAMSSRESGKFGGNMEDKMMTDGTTLYLPVFAPGAYLYLGDGHAAEGDGELTGNAMETSMDIEFSVELIRNKPNSTPRTENDKYIKSIGIASSLDQAIKIATTDMARWLETDYNLSESEVAILMGFSAEYEIPDVVGSSISVAIKLPKKVLSALKAK